MLREKRSSLQNRQISKMIESNITIRQPFVLLEKLSFKTGTKYFLEENNVMTNSSNTKRSKRIRNNNNRSQSRSINDENPSLSLTHAKIIITQNQAKSRKTRRKNVPKVLLNKNRLSPIVLLEKLSLNTVGQISGIKLKNSNLGINCLDTKLEKKTNLIQKHEKSEEARNMEVEHFSDKNISIQSDSTKINRSKLVNNVKSNVTDSIGNEQITKENDVLTQLSSDQNTSTKKCLTVEKLTNNNQIDDENVKNDLAKDNEDINNIMCLGTENSDKITNKQKLECKITQEESMTNENILINESSSCDYNTVNVPEEQCAEMTEENGSITNEILKDESISNHNTASIESIESIPTQEKLSDDNDEIHVIGGCKKQDLIDNHSLTIERDSEKELNEEEQIEISTNNLTSQKLRHDEQTTEIINSISEQNSTGNSIATIENHLVNELSKNDVMEIEKDDIVEKSSTPVYKVVNIIDQPDNDSSIGDKICEIERNGVERDKTEKTEEKYLTQTLSSIVHQEIDLTERTNSIEKQPTINKEVDKQMSVEENISTQNILSHELDHCYNKRAVKVPKNRTLKISKLNESRQLSEDEIIIEEIEEIETNKSNVGGMETNLQPNELFPFKSIQDSETNADCRSKVNQKGCDNIHNTIFGNSAMIESRDDPLNLKSTHRQLSDSSTEHQELRNDDCNEESSNEIDIEECKYSFQVSDDSMQTCISTSDSVDQSRNRALPKSNGIKINLRDAYEKITADLNTFEESFELGSNSADHHIPEIFYISDSSDDGVEITEETNLVANHKSNKVKKRPVSNTTLERERILAVISELCSGPIKLNNDFDPGISKVAGGGNAGSIPLTLYECPFCKKIFSGKLYFRKHYTNCELGNNVVCQICSRRATTVFSLEKHLEQSHPEFVQNVSANIVAREMMKSSRLVKPPTPVSANMIKVPPWISLFCPMCGDVFDSVPNTYSKQCGLCDVGLTARCLECKSYFYASAEMESHMNGCDKKKRRRKPKPTPTVNECPMCPYVTTRKPDMYRHMVKRHSRIVVVSDETCSVGCGRTFSSRLARLRHDKFCGKEPDLTCNFCPFKSKHRSAIKTHIQTHVLNNDKKLQITSRNEVGDVARLEKEARNDPILHERTRCLMQIECRKCHKISSPMKNSNSCGSCSYPLIFHCTMCSMRMPDFWKMKQHLLRNHFDKVHKCSMCRASFSYVFDLQRHVQSHFSNVTKKYRCHEFCSFRAKTRRGLEQHQVRMHPQSTATMCSCYKCGKLFTTEYPMVRHSKSCGEEPNFICDHCGFKTKSKFSLRRHMQNIHHKVFSSIYFTCEFCLKEYTNLYAYETHICIVQNK